MTQALLRALTVLATVEGAGGRTTHLEDNWFPPGDQFAIQAGTFVEALFPIGTLRYSHVGRRFSIETAFSTAVAVHGLDLGAGLAVPSERGQILGVYGGVTAVVPSLCEGCVGWHLGVSITSCRPGRAGLRMDLTHRRFREFGLTTVTAGVVWSGRPRRREAARPAR
jgi:hypothetical protein